MNSEPTKKRRGRPRKNPVVETVAETKKRRIYSGYAKEKNAVVLVKIQKLYHK